MQTRTLVKPFSAVLFLMLSGSASANSITATELMNAFGSSCPSQGEWTNKAIAQAQALGQIFTRIADDPNCQSLAGAIGSLQDVEAKIRAIQGNRTALAALEAKEQLLLTKLAETTHEATRDAIEAELRSVQVEIATFPNEALANERFKNQSYENTLAQAMASTDLLLSHALTSQKCLEDRPSLMSGIVALGGSVSAAVSQANPALSLGMSAGTQLLGNLVEQGRKWKISLKVKKLNEALLFNAYSCALEAVSGHWCSARDAIKILKLKDEARRKREESELIAAVSLYDREIPVFLEWLDKLRLGEDPKSSADAAKREKIFKRQADVLQARSRGLGLIAESAPLFDAVLEGDTSSRWGIQRKVILSIVATLGDDRCQSEHCAPISPLLDIYPSWYAPYYLLGFKPEQVPTFDGRPLSFSEFTPSSTFTPNLSDMPKRMTDWTDAATTRVNSEATLVLQPDALKALTDSIDAAKDGVRLRPLAAIGPIVEFLEKHEPAGYEYASFQSIYRDTRCRLRKIKAEVQEALDPTDSRHDGGDIGECKGLWDESVLPPNPVPPKDVNERAARAVSEIYQVADLQNGLLLLKNRLEMVTRWALLELFTKSSTIDQDVAASALAADRILDGLERTSGKKEMVLHLSDIKRSLSTSTTTLSSFGAVFGKSVGKLLKHYAQQEKLLGEETGSYLRAERTQLCLKLLSIPQWPKKVSPEYCLGLSLEPAQIGGPRSVVITGDLLKQEHGQRACHYRNYVRDSIIFEKSEANSNRSRK